MVRWTCGQFTSYVLRGKMEFQNTGFNVGKPSQCEEMWKEEASEDYCTWHGLSCKHTLWYLKIFFSIGLTWTVMNKYLCTVCHFSNYFSPILCFMTTYILNMVCSIFQARYKVANIWCNILLHVKSCMVSFLKITCLLSSTEGRNQKCWLKRQALSCIVYFWNIMETVTWRFSLKYVFLVVGKVFEKYVRTCFFWCTKVVI